VTEAELLLHLGEVEARQLHLARASSTIFRYCVDRLGFSEDVAYARMRIAEAGRRFPAVIDAVASGKVHLTGLRLLVPHLTEENHLALLQEATGKSRRYIEELIARIAPKEDAPDLIRRVPAVPASGVAAPLLAFSSNSAPAAVATPLPPVEPIAAIAPARVCPVSAATTSAVPREDASITPLSADAFRFQFTGSRELRDDVRALQALLGHRRAKARMGAIFAEAAKLLRAKVEKERFGVGAKPRALAKGKAKESAPAAPVHDGATRHVPREETRTVYARDEARCAFIDEVTGQRCNETRCLQVDHTQGFARTRRHGVDELRLLCAAHNRYEAGRMYGRAFMEAKVAEARVSSRDGKVGRPNSVHVPGVPAE
jgi:hypothetical protein